MDNRPPRSSFFLKALRRAQQPKTEPEPQPNWFRYLLEQQGAIPPPRRKPTNPLSRVSLPPLYIYPFINADEALRLAVWRKGTPIAGYDSDVMRHDREGSIMLYSQHGNCKSDYGWEIDHIVPLASNGSDSLYNLQPLQWQNNRRKGDKFTSPRLGLRSLGKP